MSAPGELFEEGLNHHRAGRLDEAEKLYRLALETDANHADSLHLLGMISLEAGRLGESAEMIRRAIVLNPGAASYYANLGNVLQRQGLVREAAESYLQALRIRSDLAEVHVNLGNVFLEAEQLEQAVTWYRSGLTLNPAMAGAERCMGDALRRLGRLEEALEAYERSLRLEPGSADAWHWAGKVLRELGDLEGALRCFRAAQAIEPKHPRAGFGEAMVLLLMRQFGVGWAKYEGRWESLDHGTPMREYAWPVWCGERLESGKVLLWPEQGVGDEIMFAGMLRDAVETGNQVVLACDARLQGLMERSFPEVEVVADGVGCLRGLERNCRSGACLGCFGRVLGRLRGCGVGIWWLILRGGGCCGRGTEMSGVWWGWLGARSMFIRGWGGRLSWRCWRVCLNRLGCGGSVCSMERSRSWWRRLWRRGLSW